MHGFDFRFYKFLIIIDGEQFESVPVVPVTYKKNTIQYTVIMSFLNMHFRLGNYEYMGGKYLPLVKKGSRHRGWDQTGITQTLQKYKTRVRSVHSHIRYR